MPKSLKVGVAVAMIVSFLGLLPILHLFMGQCFFEQGCGEYEDLGLIGVVLASCAIGIFCGWGVARIMTMAAERRTRKSAAREGAALSHSTHSLKSSDRSQQR